MDVNRYIQKLQTWATSFFAKKAPPVTTHRSCVYFKSNQLNLLHINQIDGAYEILLDKTVGYDSLDHLPLVLQGMVEAHDLKNIPTTWLLTPEYYQLFMIEALPVAKEEFKEALNWRVRSLINYPESEASIDYFLLPPTKTAAENNMMAVAISKLQDLEPIMSALIKSNIDLKLITIPELAMRNLTALNEQDERSTAYLYFYNNAVILNITREKKLYFTKRLEVASENDPNDYHYEDLSLKILRYFDYFQTQWRFPSPNRIYVSAAAQNSESIAKQLSEYLPSEAIAYQVSVFPNPEQNQKMTKDALLAFGALLAIEGEGHAKTAN